MTSDNKSVLAFNLSFLFPQKDLLSGFVREMLGWIEEGKLRPPTVTTYPFEKVAEAHKAIESGTTIGKLILTIDHEKLGKEEERGKGKEKEESNEERKGLLSKKVK